MRNKVKMFLILFLYTIPMFSLEVIRINELGYLPQSKKVAVFLSTENVVGGKFEVYNCISGKKVFENNAILKNASIWGMKSAFQLDFSDLDMTGGFYIIFSNAKSACFRISYDIYSGSSDFILQYLRQQRCGFNPFLNDSCHTHDGIIVDHPVKSGEHIDVTGGWHDAADYLQYVTTSATSVYQLMLAFKNNPEIFSDSYLSNGLRGTNGIPDILDEIKWGLDWMLKMNPEKNEMYNQIADDRDHRGFRIPTLDTVSYGLENARPVYFVTGKPQGLNKFKNRSTGVASTAAKFSSVFALGAILFSDTDKNFSDILRLKALEAWDFAKSDPGVNQTACYASPYFYEEENYVDDMELAAITLYELTNNKNFLEEAKYWGKLEPVTPWIELNRARHYEYYPFVNIGHYLISNSEDTVSFNIFSDYLRQGLQKIKTRAEADPFNIGIPFIWCSNNLIVAASIQARLYRNLTNSEEYYYNECALTDWLFGCNPWGTSMICGFPSGSDFPDSPHSAFRLTYGKTTTGGLVDGPVYSDIYENLKGIMLYEPDEYSVFQNGKAVYHDDIGDYSTNEPTLDGSASLGLLLSLTENQTTKNIIKDVHGAIINFGSESNKIYLIFSAHEFNDGGNQILKSLNRNKIKASFFFTGDFYRNNTNAELIKNLIQSGNYLGCHSDKHLLYNDWNVRDSMLIDRHKFEEDIISNYAELSKYDIEIDSVKYFLPPFEWYNSDIVNWAGNMGLEVINLTPGIGTNADYTVPDMKNYKSSKSILHNLNDILTNDKKRLNGSIILIHLGTHPDRKDKLYNKLDKIIQMLKKQGFEFEKL